ncbi:unnamed protein product, partial [Amoebophrya sp. A120]
GDTTSRVDRSSSSATAMPDRAAGAQMSSSSSSRAAGGHLHHHHHQGCATSTSTAGTRWNVKKIYAKINGKRHKAALRYSPPSMLPAKQITTGTATASGGEEGQLKIKRQKGGLVPRKKVSTGAAARKALDFVYGGGIITSSRTDHVEDTTSTARKNIRQADDKE